MGISWFQMSTLGNLSVLQERAIGMEQLSDQLFEKGFGVWDNFIPSSLVSDLNKLAQQLYQNNCFKKAGVGASYMNTIDKSVRGDHIYWIDQHSDQPAIQDFVLQLNDLLNYLNHRCYAGVRDFEMHFAIYPVGTHYQKHIDQLQINGQRMFSVICYLNEDWVPTDGGCLRLYLENESLTIEPVGGRLVIFKSDQIPHEVLTTNSERVALTGWLLNQPKTLTFV